jgi:repressor LexA
MDLERHARALKEFHGRNRRMPSYSEMLKLFGYKSKNAVWKAVERLIEAGVILKDKTGALLPAKMPGEVPLVGYVEAGMPSVAEAAQLDTVSVSDFLIQNPADDVYALKVKGDSMVDAGIHNNDTVLVKRIAHARAGQIVVAEIDGQWTMKYLREKKGRQYLEAANPDYPDLHPEETLQVGGIVIGVIRRYG